MKSSSITVEFKDPAKDLKTQLERMGAKNIDIRKGFRGELEVRFTLAAGDPNSEIEKLLEQAGAQNVRSSSTYSGARFDYRLNDMVDEREFKKKMSDTLRRAGYRMQ